MSLASSRLCARLLLCTLLSVALLLGAAPAAHASTSTTSVEVDLASLLNAERRSHGLPSLRIDVRLVDGSRRWSQQMARDNRLAHHPRLHETVPPQATVWAENVGTTSATSDIARRLHAAFMSSSQHRAAILDGRYTDLGIGVGTGHGRYWATQRFTAGAPAAVAPAVEATAGLARKLFSSGSAKHAVVTRDDVYADALAAGPLAGAEGPLLITPPGPVLHPSVRLALETVLPRGATVSLVGGSAAVSAGVEQELAAAGWTVRRVAGAHRIETAERAARAVVSRHGRPDTVMVATAADWPDAAAGGAFGSSGGVPVVLSHNDQVPPETARFLRDVRSRRVAALGGSTALSDRVVKEIGGQRIAGGSRQGTSAEIARSLWGYTDATPATWIAVPAFDRDAWTWALGAAPLAARRDAAVLLVGPELSGRLRDYLAGLGYGKGRRAELIVHGPVPASGAAEVNRLLGN